MGAIFVSLEMNHAIQTSERCATALIAMRIEFFLGEDVSAGLRIIRSALLSLAPRACASRCFRRVE